jgi:flagellar hook-length control protein FliK
MVLHLAGEAGQVSLALAASSAGARASVDQHAAEIRDALAKRGREVRMLIESQGLEPS